MREELESRLTSVLVVGLMLGCIALRQPLASFGALCMVFWLRPLAVRVAIFVAFFVGWMIAPSPPIRLLEPRSIHGVASVCSVPTLTADAQTMELQIDKLTLLATLPREPSLSLGDEIEVDGVAQPLSMVGPSIHTFDPAAGSIKLNLTKVVSHGSGIARLATIWRRSFQNFLQESLPPDQAALVDAVSFNGRGMLDFETREQFASTGLIHLFSASGLQVFVLALLLSMGLRFFPLQRSTQIAILGAVLVLYSIGAGLQPQVVRASLMMVLGMSAYLFGRDPDALSALSFSCLAYLLWKPEALFTMAFQLSFITLAFIALFYRTTPANRSDKGSQFIRVANDFLRLSAIVVAATTPLIAYSLGVISPLTIPANLCVGWSIPLVVGLAFGSHGISLFVPELGRSIANHVLGPLADWVLHAAGWWNQAAATIKVPSFDPLWLLVYFGAWLLTYRRRIVQP